MGQFEGGCKHIRDGRHACTAKHTFYLCRPAHLLTLSSGKAKSKSKKEAVESGEEEEEEKPVVKKRQKAAAKPRKPTAKPVSGGEWHYAGEALPVYGWRDTQTLFWSVRHNIAWMSIQNVGKFF